MCGFGTSRRGTVGLRARLLKLCGKIDHWKITNREYYDLPNKRATWYVDPPYQHHGGLYVHSSEAINFDDLGSWCRERKGQTIVCEYSDATWLDFNPINSKMRAQQRKGNYTEVMWYRSDIKQGFGLRSDNE